MSTATSTPTTAPATSPAARPGSRPSRPATRPLAHPARPPARPRRSRRSGLVLTRRGRRAIRAAVLVTTTSVVALLLVLAWLGAAASVAPAASAGDGRPGVVSGALSSRLAAEAPERVEVVVRPGDTLWQIARSNAPDRDPRSVVADIVRLNDLPSTAVAAGAVLVVPAS